jgi:hypothetical protein
MQPSVAEIPPVGLNIVSACEVDKREPLVRKSGFVCGKDLAFCGGGETCSSFQL